MIMIMTERIKKDMILRIFKLFLNKQLILHNLNSPIQISILLLIIVKLQELKKRRKLHMKIQSKRDHLICKKNKIHSNIKLKVKQQQPKTKVPSKRLIKF